jgi:hypothetical protein
MHPVTRHHETAGRPRGPTGTPRASLRQTHGGRSAKARVPPVDSADDPLRRRRTTVWIKLPGGQFFVSPGGQFRMSFDDVYGSCCDSITG